MFKKLSIVICICLFSKGLLAQNSVNLNETVVTASKYEQKQMQTGKVLTIVNDSILRSNSNLTVGQLLNQQVGIQTVASGQTMGSTQYVSMRGSNTGLVLILMDGVPVNEPSGIGQTFDINLLSVNQIERIEILKGGQSTIYGSDAVAGVINIITKKPINKKFSGGFASSLGSFGTIQNNLSLMGKFKKVDYQISFGKTKSKGFSSATEPNNALKFAPNPFESTNFSIRIDRTLSQKLHMYVLHRNSQYTTSLDYAAFVDETDYTSKNKNKQYALGAEYAINKGKVHFNYFRNNTDRSYLDDSTQIITDGYYRLRYFKYLSKADFAEIYLHQSLNPKMQILLGADYRKQKMESSGYSLGQYDYKDTPINSKINNSSIYGSLAAKNIKDFGFEIGGRLNHHSTYGFSPTYSLNSYYIIQKKLKFFATMSSSYRNPALYQLYSPYGNLDLKPETGLTKEIGTQFLGKIFNFRAVYFNNNLKNIIFFQSSFEPPYGKYINQNRQVNQGVELEGSVKISNLELSTSYTFLSGKTYDRQNGKDTVYNFLIRRPQKTLKLNLSYKINSFVKVNINSQSCSVQHDTFFNPATYGTDAVILKAYTLINANVYFQPTKNLNINLGAQNLANTTYTEIYGYKSRPRTITFGVNWGF